MDNDLTRLRAQIDLVDQQLLDLLSRRLKMAEQVAEVKPNSASIFRPDREAQLLARLCAAADPQLQPVIIAVWRAVISSSIARQYPDFTILMTDESEQTARLFAAGQLSVKQTGVPLEGIVRPVFWRHKKSGLLEAQHDKSSCGRDVFLRHKKACLLNFQGGGSRRHVSLEHQQN